MKSWRLYLYGGYPKLWYPQQKHWEKPSVRYSLSLLFGASNTSLGNPGTYRHRSARTTTVRIQTVATYGLDQVLKSCKNTPKIWYFVGISSEIYTVYQCKMYLDNDEQDTLNMKAKTFEVQWYTEAYHRMFTVHDICQMRVCVLFVILTEVFWHSFWNRT